MVVAMQYGQSHGARPVAAEYDLLLRKLLNGDPRAPGGRPRPG